MASEMQRYDTNEDDEEMGMDVKEEDDEDDDDEEKNAAMHAMAGFDGVHGSSSSSRFQHHQQYQEQPTPGGSRRCRPVEEKERTKLRERQRRAITAKILAGLRRHGNYNLRVRADINDVIAALAREADGQVTQNDPFLVGCVDSIDKQVIDMHTKLQERDFAGTHYIPVYVMLPLGVINMKSELVDADGLVKQLRMLKSINVDGVMVDCWWGIVEANAPQEYNWNGYKRLFQVVREHKLKIKVMMSFHECGGNIGDDVCIPLPHWVSEIGRSNPDIYFTDRAGRRNPECLSWGIDKERVLRGRTAVEVYFDYMRSFRVGFDEFFEDGIISMVEVGLGPCGELRYPSNPVKHGWRYPGVGEFQCYDQYLLKSLKKAAEARGHSFWARAPDNAGSYNSRPQETGFFCDGGDYDGYYGRFFLNWYSQVLVDHADRVLSLAKLAFDGTCIAAKLSGIHWWYKTAGHAAELTAGFYNPSNRDGYIVIAAMLKKHGAALNFKCAEMSMLEQAVDFSEALVDPEGLAWQVLNAAWDVSLPVCSENALLCHDRGGYNCLLEKAKPFNDPDGKHIFAFTYLRLSPLLMDGQNYMEFERFVKRMHGEAVLDFQS
ncbi:Beta-amylase [Capsicum annuum]|uniref:Beta-amylase n=1 Tax=Capsicum annuum TaxID=4072 RepID=A0A2G2YXP1_CAPAN|nr:Beta-amylase [Capsicum annuum]